MIKMNNSKNKGLSISEKLSVLKRDNHSCQKCKLEDKTAKNLEVHHIKPIVFGGTNDKENLITLCHICHKYATNTEEEFEEYMDSECDGQLTLLIKIMKEFKKKKL